MYSSAHIISLWCETQLKFVFYQCDPRSPAPILYCPHRPHTFRPSAGAVAVLSLRLPCVLGPPPLPPQSLPPRTGPGVTSRFVCDLCGKTLRSEASLSNHRSIHRGSTRCRLCGGVYSTISALRRHVRMSHPGAPQSPGRQAPAAVAALGAGVDQQRQQHQPGPPFFSPPPAATGARAETETSSTVTGSRPWTQHDANGKQGE